MCNVGSRSYSCFPNDYTLYYRGYFLSLIHIYQHDVNIYRGCEHGCLYCYALYSHDYLEDEKFYDHIYYKENIVEILEKEISKKSWQKKIINFGSVSDSYQPCEKKLELMRDVLKLMIKYQNPVNISTKSTLILRDLDLINELSKVAMVNICLLYTSCISLKCFIIIILIVVLT